MKSKYIVVVFTVLLVIMVTLKLDLKNIIQAATLGDVGSLSEIIASAGIAALMVSIFLNIIISILGIIPSIFITAANILVFGLYIGFLVSWVGEVVGATISFLLFRWGIKSVAKISSEHWQLSRAVNSLPPARQIYFLTVIRLAPFIPSGLINLFGAITSVSLINFLIATAIGKIPALMLETAFSYNIININQNYIYLAISALVALIMYFGVKKELGRLK